MQSTSNLNLNLLDYGTREWHTYLNDNFQILDELSQKADLKIPINILNLKDKEIIHRNNCNKEDMKKMLLNLLKAGDIDD